MKLLRIVNLLSKSRAQRAELEAAARQRVGVAWSHCEKRIESDPALGEFVAYDVTITGMIGEVPTWRTAERLTNDRGDYGRVLDVFGEVVGRVASMVNGVVTLELFGHVSESEIASRAGADAGGPAMPDDWVPA